jgi:hypothetical protein
MEDNRSGRESRLERDTLVRTSGTSRPLTAPGEIQVMNTLIRIAAGLAVAAAGTVGAAALTAAAPENTLEIVIVGGPNAGTYKPPASDVSCMYLKQQKQFNAVYKDFDAKDPKKVGEAGINILNPDDPGPKRGNVLVDFGSREDERASKYSISIPEAGATLTVNRSGKTAEITFQGRTKTGIAIRMTAKCLAIDEM